MRAKQLRSDQNFDSALRETNGLAGLPKPSQRWRRMITVTVPSKISPGKLKNQVQRVSAQFSARVGFYLKHVKD
jgi:hypothetical protein